MKQYLFTERAHLMCPNMCFGISILLDVPYQEERILSTFDAVSSIHPFLNAVLGYEEDKNRYYYRVTESPKFDLDLTGIETEGPDGPAVMSAYNAAVSLEWDLTEEGMLKVFAFRCGSRTVFLFVFHHLLADGRSAFELAENCARLYSEGIPAEATVREPVLIASAADLPEGSRLPMTSRLLISAMNRKWNKERHTVSYQEYLAFADNYLRNTHTVRSVLIKSKDETAEMIRACRESAVSVNDLLLAKMFVEDRPEKIIIAEDIRSKLRCYRTGALGNYSTAFSIRHRPASGDVLEEARIVRKKVLKLRQDTRAVMTVLSCYAEMDPGLLDAAAISSLGGYSSKSGDFVGTNMFGFRSGSSCSITNLGRFESPYMEYAVFVPPASPAVGKILGVLTVNGRISLCTCEKEV